MSEGKRARRRVSRASGRRTKRRLRVGPAARKSFGRRPGPAGATRRPLPGNCSLGPAGQRAASLKTPLRLVASARNRRPASRVAGPKGMKARQHGAQRPPAHQIEGRASAVGLRGGSPGQQEPASQRYQPPGSRLFIGFLPLKAARRPIGRSEGKA